MLLLTGSAGAGKSATVHVLANELGFEVQEWINPLSETDGKSLGGGLPHIRMGRYQGPVLWAWLELFHP